jgi:hypothetical protein
MDDPRVIRLVECCSIPNTMSIKSLAVDERMHSISIRPSCYYTPDYS